MLDGSAACDKREANIGDRRTGQDADMLPFLKVREDEALPVSCQHIRRAVSTKLKAAAARKWFHEKVHLRIMPEWFEVSDSLDGCGNRFFIENFSLAESNVVGEALLHEAGQHLGLHGAHERDVDLLQLLIETKVKLWKFLAERAKTRVECQGVSILTLDLVVEHRRECRILSFRLSAKRHAGFKSGHTRDDSNASGCHFITIFIALATIDAELRDLFTGQELIADAKDSTGDFQEAKFLSLLVSGNLKDAGTKGVRVKW